MNPILKTITQEFNKELKSITYAIIKNKLFNDIRIQIFENGNFVNEVDCNSLNDANSKVQRYIKLEVCPFYY